MVFDIDDDALATAHARYAAERKLGNIRLIREEIYQMNSIAIFEPGTQRLDYHVGVITDITDRKKLTGAVLAGIGLGMWLGWRRGR